MITKDMTVSQITELSEGHKALGRWFFASEPRFLLGGSRENWTLEQWFGPGTGLAAGAVDHFARQISSGAPCLLPIYTREQIMEAPDRGKTQLLYLPGRSEMPPALICPGGGYMNVMNFLAGIPAAESLNRMGHPVFILIYRVETEKKKLMPKPVEDLAQALRVIQDREKELGVSLQNYSLVGFSAGGHLAAMWGTEKHGYRRYGLPAPAALLLAFPAVSTDAFYFDNDRLPLETFEAPSSEAFLSRLSGENPTRKNLLAYSPEAQIDPGYPPVYLIHCEDDKMVPYRSSLWTAERLSAFRIPFRFCGLPTGGHGFGVGIGTAAEGWLEEAEAFWMDQIGE